MKHSDETEHLDFCFGVQVTKNITQWKRETYSRLLPQNEHLSYYIMDHLESTVSGEIEVLTLSSSTGKRPHSTFEQMTLQEEAIAGEEENLILVDV